MSETKPSPRRSLEAVALAIIFAGYIAARTLEIVPTPVPRMAIVALDVLSALAFALVHGGRAFGLRTMLVFAGLCVVIGNIMENLGVATGFPYGHYYFVELMGPKLFQVPILLGLAYIGMAYVSWVLGQTIVGDSNSPGLFAVPVASSFIMVAWDLAQDPVWATALHGWVWRDGGAWFGVPVANYMGWYLTVFLIYMGFSLYLRRLGAKALRGDHARPAILFYLACAAGNVCQVFGHPEQAVVADPSGHAWRVADITAASALVSVFAMGGFAAIAWIRRGQKTKFTTD